VAVALGGPFVARAAEKPAPQVYGGIEIGAKGIKAVVLRIADTPDGLDIQPAFSRTANVTLVGGTGGTGRFDPNAVKQTVEEVAKLHKTMREDYKVEPQRLFIVGSSGLFSGIEGKDELIKANKETLSDAIFKVVGVKMDFVTARQEAELSIVGIVPRRYIDTSVLADIGSGNTKGGLRSGANGPFTTFNVPWGSVTLTDAVAGHAKRVDKPFTAAAEEVGASVVGPALRNELNRNPVLRERKRIYLSGGMIWAMATIVKPGDRRPYTELTAEDVETFRRTVCKDPEKFPEVDLSGITDEKAKAEAAKDLQRVRDTYTPRNLVAGAELVTALSTEFRFREEGRSVYFARNGYLGWIVAYVVERTAAPK
jgi:exopolyphosphatase/pppGpp-phosphohydrolase